MGFVLVFSILVIWVLSLPSNLTFLLSAGRDMDLVELSAYGNVRRGPDSGGCKIQ
jgi:hypothetical protein